MTTNLYAVAGPSKPSSIGTTSSPSPKSGSESPSPLKSITTLPPSAIDSAGASVGVQKTGLSVDGNGEVLKVPAFLNKLYTMVSDHEVDDLIYWGEDGDSFYVPNAEQFGRELLPRWFKHSNFSSFVRQLNMYGFHKVPHLQSGALKNETPVELWEFANPFFKRGQPKLLAKVTRKNNRPGTVPTAPSTGSGSLNTRSATQATQAATVTSSSPAPQGKYLITDGSVEGEAGQLVGTSSQLMDLNAIHSGIAAIRQTQATIGADLRKLQASNEALWRQAYETQEKQRKHEETIDLIVSFLERLFGTEGSGLKGLKEAMRRGGVGRQREDGNGEETGGSAKKRKRMGLDRMISDGKNVNMEVDDFNEDDDLVEIGSRYPIPPFKRTDSGTTPDPWSFSAPRFTTLPTEDESGTPLSRAASASKTATPGGDQTLGANHLSPLSDTDHLLPSDNNALARYNAPSNLPFTGNSDNTLSSSINPTTNTGANTNTNTGHSSGSGSAQPLLSPTSAEAAASAFNLDPSLLQTTIGSLLQSPAAAQMFLNSLNNSVQGQALQSPSLYKATSAPMQNQQSFFAPHATANTDIKPSLGAQGNAGAGAGAGGNGDLLDPTLALFSPLPGSNSNSTNAQSQDALMSNTDALLKSYQDAVSVNGGVDHLQESIDSLVRSMGLDIPGAGAGTGTDYAHSGHQQGMGQNVGAGEQLVDPDFNVDEFLEHLAKEDPPALEHGQGSGVM